MGLLDLLPFLNGWSWEAILQSIPITIPAGKTINIADLHYSGWLCCVEGAFSNPNTTLIVTWDKGVRTAAFSPYDLYSMGLTFPHPVSGYTPRYTAIPPIYTVVMSPTNPYPFKTGLKIDITNPTALPVSAYDYSYMAILVTNEDEFLESLRNLKVGVE